MKSMFNEATFRDILPLSLGKEKCFVVHIYRKYADLDEVNRT